MIEITTIYFVWLLRIFQPYLILSIENLLNTKPLLNLPIINMYRPFNVITIKQNYTHKKVQKHTSKIKDYIYIYLKP